MPLEDVHLSPLLRAADVASCLSPRDTLRDVLGIQHQDLQQPVSVGKFQKVI